MDPFPTELWERIIQNLKRHDLAVLATTCQFLHIVSESLLYQNIDLKHLPPSNIDDFYRSLAARSHLGALVHTVSYRLSYSAVPPNPTPLQPSLFPNLQELELLDPEVDATFLSTIFNVLPRLRALVFSQPKITNDLVAGQHADASNIQASSLQSLHINGFCITKPIADLLSYFTRCRHTPALTTLKIVDYDLVTKLKTEDYNLSHAILPFLLSTPSLRHLELRTPDPDPSHPIYALPAPALPLLTHFTGSVALAAVFVPGRPVRSVKLHVLGTHPDDILRMLGDSTVPITALHLDHLGPWLRHAPQTLRRLGWGYVAKDYLLASIPTWPPMPHLAHIQGFVHRPLGGAQTIGKPAQREIIRAVCAAYPSVRACVFTTSYEPERRAYAWGRVCGSGRWECRVQSAEM